MFEAGVTPAHLINITLWSLLATFGMTATIQASQGLGLSRLSLYFLVGTFFTSRRTYANLLGFLIYVIGGTAFAFLYIFIFLTAGFGTWWGGLLLGVIHGLVLLVVILPLIPYLHPRMASEYDGPTRTQRLEPPGFIGLNYGYRTPVTVLVAQGVFGIILGLCFELSSLGKV